MKRLFGILLFSILLIAGFLIFRPSITNKPTPSIPTTPTPTPFPLFISAMRQKEYPGSAITTVETLSPGSNYSRQVVSYESEGLTIHALLTVPTTQTPEGGFPAIIFNHGYIPPEQYRTTERYLAYTDAFSRNGYVVMKPDYRGHGDSEGTPEGAYYSPSYTTDVLNALASIKKYPNVNPKKIGMWGHSMGGNITLRILVTKPNEVQAAVIWGGVVGSYDDLMNNWQRRVPYQPSQRELANRNNRRQSLIATYKTPKENPEFWNAIDPTNHLDVVTAPVQLHSGQSDEEVPYLFSQSLYDKLTKLHKAAELYLYPGGDHNISSPHFEVAIQRSLSFFERSLK